MVLILGADLYVACNFRLWYLVSSRKQTWTEAEQHADSCGVGRNRLELEAVFSCCFFSFSI